MNNGACSIFSKRLWFFDHVLWGKSDRLAQFPPRIKELNFNDNRLLSDDATFSGMHSRKKSNHIRSGRDNIGEGNSNVTCLLK